MLARQIWAKFAQRLCAISERREPDFVIGGSEHPYLLRYFLIPRNPIFNAFLHVFLRSDDDRALHDRPWPNCSIVLRGNMVEHTIAAGGIHKRRQLVAGTIRIRALGSMAHRIEINEGPCYTLFLTGPRYREWGFHCPDAGWIHWRRFVDERDEGAIGRGCE